MPDRYADLVRKARDGSVRVIVIMRLDAEPSGARAYREKVEETAEDLLAELTEFDVEKGHIYRNLPMFAAEVDEPALRYLIRSDRVERVSEDRLEKPQ